MFAPIGVSSLWSAQAFGVALELEARFPNILEIVSRSFWRGLKKRRWL
jgi:hypothetical protein